MTAQPQSIPLCSDDGHAWNLIAIVPERPRAALLWLPALGVAAKHYIPFAEALAARGVAVYLHEWRGNGSSSLRPDKAHDWGYRELLTLDLPRSQDAVLRAQPNVPHWIGGHSLGGQLACCYAALDACGFQQLWLVASGTPHWRTFPAPLGWLLPFVYQFLPWLAKWRGRLNGRRLGFGGMESRGLIRDWAKVGLGGRYAAAGMDIDFEEALARLAIPRHCVVFAQDWMAPRESLAALLAKLAPAQSKTIGLNATQLGTRADHFAWMKQPDSVAECLLE
jgi:predicted alpha/beta hydrolase